MFPLDDNFVFGDFFFWPKAKKKNTQPRKKILTNKRSYSSNGNTFMPMILTFSVNQQLFTSGHTLGPESTKSKLSDTQIYPPQHRKNWKKPFYLREFETHFRNRIFVIILVSLRSVLRILWKKLRNFSSISLSSRRIWKSISDQFWRWYFFHENQSCQNDQISRKKIILVKFPNTNRCFFLHIFTFLSFWNSEMTISF